MKPCIDWSSIKASPRVPDVSVVDLMLIQIRTRVAMVEKILAGKKGGVGHGNSLQG